MKRKRFVAGALLGACLSSVGMATWASTYQEVQVVEFARDSAYLDEDGAKVAAARLKLAQPQRCGGEVVYVTAESLGMPAGADLSRGYSYLAGLAQSGATVRMSLPQCVGEAALLFDLKPCTPGDCRSTQRKPARPDDVLYLDKDLASVHRRDAEYQLQLPLERDEALKLWKLRIRTLDGESLYAEGYADAADYVSGKLVGPYKTYYHDGRVEKEMRFDASGALDGEYASWYESGRLHQKLRYAGGKPADGETVAYYDSGAVAVREHYRDGELDGPYEEFHPNGKLKHSGPFVKGAKVGPVRSYWEDGRLQHEGTYVEGGLDGWSISYFQDGKVEEKQRFDNGRQLSYGRWNKAGVQTVQWQWDAQHVAQGEFREWHENGKPKSLKTYQDGKLNGPARNWDETGKLSWECNYRDDESLCKTR